ncbi:SPASM domain-containing protein [Lagierella sp.]|uniref:SPASM domain-containing protein n=1 Tax=Lagierella sp. TaxID=2849657 RepID=UPI003450132B
MCFRNPCGAGKNQLHLSAYGEFFPCQDWKSINDYKICDIFNIKHSLNSHIKNHYRCQLLTKKNYENNKEMCKDCEWIAYCGTCPREIYTHKKNEKKIGLCLFNNLVYEELCWLIYKNENDVLKYLEVN